MTTKMEKKMIGAFYKLTEENIELHKQIAALKAALQSDRAYIHSANVIETQPMDACFVGMAKESLARELPMIDWEDMK